MKKNHLINSNLNNLIGKLGHMDEFTVADCGLPIPNNTLRIDLALVRGTPSFLETVDAILQETKIESLTLASEFMEISPDLHQEFLQRIAKEEKILNTTINIYYLPHAELKQQTSNSKAVVRTGECTPYANVIFSAGVSF